MAHRKHQSTASSMLDHRARPGPVPHGQGPESEAAELPLGEYMPEGLELAALRPESPAPGDQGCRDHSPDGDSSSDYVNNTSEEEDYDEGLPEEEGITYYIRYCPEDDSYLEGMDCNGEGDLAPGVRRLETDQCPGAVEEWTDSAGLHPHGSGDEGSPDYQAGHRPIPEDEASILEAQDQEDGVHYCPSEEGYPDYYPTEANGNAGSASPYRPRRGDGDLEDQEEDIDQIVAEIKMSLSMTSITSAGEASPERVLVRGPEPGPGDSTEACVPHESSQRPSRHEGRPKSLTLPPEVKHPGDPQRGFKIKSRTPEERPKWPQEQVGFWLSPGKRAEGPRKQRMFLCSSHGCKACSSQCVLGPPCISVTMHVCGGSVPCRRHPLPPKRDWVSSLLALDLFLARLVLYLPPARTLAGCGVLANACCCGQ